MNNFFASVECMLNPELKDFPVAVCGDASKRHGIVLAKNYKAKAYGVMTGEAIWQAKNKCKNLVIVSPQYDEYIKYSKLAYKIYERYTDYIEPFGIDECWLDMTGTQKLFGSGYEVAYKIKETIKSELGLTISCGVSYNKIFAKLGSDIKKPDAITEISRENFKDTVWPLPVSDLFGVGKKTNEILKSMQINTIGELANTKAFLLEPRLKSRAYQLISFANGLDSSPVMHKDTVIPAKSVGHGTTTAADLKSNNEVRIILLKLVQTVSHKLRSYEQKACGISVSVRNSSLITERWQTKLKTPTQTASYMAESAYELFEKSYQWKEPIRSLTVCAIDLIPEDMPYQLSFFNDAEKEEKLSKLDKTVDDIRRRFGNDSIVNAVLCGNYTF